MAPKTPAVQAAPVNSEIDPESQAKADEAARQAKERQQKGTTSSKTILTSGAGVLDNTEDNLKKNSLG
jgi:hypothetical protein